MTAENDNHEKLAVTFTGQAAHVWENFDAVDTIGEFCEQFFDHIAKVTNAAPIWKDESVLNDAERTEVDAFRDASLDPENHTMIGFEAYDTYFKALSRIHGAAMLARQTTIFLFTAYRPDALPHITELEPETLRALNMPSLDTLLSTALRGTAPREAAAEDTAASSLPAPEQP